MISLKLQRRPLFIPKTKTVNEHRMGRDLFSHSLNFQEFIMVRILQTLKVLTVSEQYYTTEMPEITT